VATLAITSAQKRKEYAIKQKYNNNSNNNNKNYYYFISFKHPYWPRNSHMIFRQTVIL
jgi:hypothetical protein